MLCFTIVIVKIEFCVCVCVRCNNLSSSTFSQTCACCYALKLFQQTTHIHSRFTIVLYIMYSTCGQNIQVDRWIGHCACALACVTNARACASFYSTSVTTTSTYNVRLCRALQVARTEMNLCERRYISTYAGIFTSFASLTWRLVHKFHRRIIASCDSRICVHRKWLHRCVMLQMIIASDENNASCFSANVNFVTNFVFVKKKMGTRSIFFVVVSSPLFQSRLRERDRLR